MSDQAFQQDLEQTKVQIVALRLFIDEMRDKLEQSQATLARLEQLLQSKPVLDKPLPPDDELPFRR